MFTSMYALVGLMKAAGRHLKVYWVVVWNMHAIKSTKMWHSWGFKNWRLHVSAGPSVEAVIYKTSSCVDDDIDM